MVVAEGHVLFVAPYVLLQSRVVNIGIAVVLTAVHGIVAIYLLLAYRVFLGPPQQHLDEPCLVGRVCVASKHGRLVPRGYLVLVASGHVEVDAGKIALVLIVWLEHCARIALY